VSDPARIDVVGVRPRRLACLADVHGNVAALDAVLKSEQFATVDAVAFLGCFTTGPEPDVVLQRCAGLGVPAYFLAGNGERAVLELADGGTEDWPVGHWILARHGAAGLDTIRSWPAGLVIEVEGIGGVRLCHGSPRSDIELFTPRTSPERIADATADTPQRVIVHGHTHLQYERHVGATRVIGAGSVGQPYTTGEFGARWAILGTDAELITTSYDIAEARRRVTECGYPDPRFMERLERPPDPETIIADCETRLFSD
jgi:predicted phosphodiesterase